MTEHSIDELKRQLDQAQARLDAAKDAFRARSREYQNALCAQTRTRLESEGFVFGTNLVEYRRRGWSETKRTRAVPMDVVWKYSAPRVVFRHVRADGSLGKREDVLSVGEKTFDDLKLSEITFIGKTEE